MRRSLVAMTVIGIAGGVAVDRWAFVVDQPLLWAPDLAVGVVLIIAGASVNAARVRGPGVLLAAAGVAWFVGTAVPEATYWHRGVVVHLLVAYPGGRPVSRAGWVVLGAGYGVAVVSPLWRNDATSLVVGSVGLAISVVALTGTRIHRQRTSQVASEVGAGLSAVVLLGAVVRLTLPAEVSVLPSLLAYEAALVVAAGRLWVGLRPASVIAVTDLVVELGGARSAPLRAALADLLGDPAARLGYWHASQAAYVDETGRTLSERAADTEQTLMTIDREGHPFVALLHDSAIGTDSTMAEAVNAAHQLMSAHAALQAEIRAGVAEVSASRHRLQHAVDGERRRLEHRLANAAEAQLIALLGSIQRIPSDGDAHLTRAVDQLERTLVDLHEAASGLHPRELAGGLSAAVAALSDRCPVPVELSVTRRRFDPETEMAAYYLCAEALTNVAKHAEASVARVEVTAQSGALVVTVTDDGIGGAVVAGGSGILGLIDRVESIGGTLRMESEPGTGTTLAAEFPQRPTSTIQA